VASAKILGTGATSPPPQIPRIPGETERKLKLLQVCPRNLSHCRGAPHGIVPDFVPCLLEDCRVPLHFQTPNRGLLCVRPDMTVVF
jgi:hypothetical protein